MLHILWRERSSKMLKTSSILGSLSQMICEGIHVSNICTKVNWSLGFLSYDGLHPETVAQNSSQVLVGAHGFVGSLPHCDCIMIYSYHQMCPVLNSKPCWRNKQFVPLLSCCSDAPVAPGNCLVICGDRTFFQPNFGSIFGKNCCTFATLCVLK